jgi:hypothetical protein
MYVCMYVYTYACILMHFSHAFFADIFAISKIMNGIMYRCLYVRTYVYILTHIHFLQAFSRFLPLSTGLGAVAGAALGFMVGISSYIVQTRIIEEEAMR